jgi:type I restriction enzyme S subunit
MEAVGESWEVDYSRTRPLAEVRNGYTYFRDGDILVAKITPCFENGKGALVNGCLNRFGFGTTEFHVIRSPNSETTKFLSYVVRSYRFKVEGAGMMTGTAGQKRLSDDYVKDFEVFLPPILEREKIARFLDRKTTLIDTLIAKKQRLIQLLEEKRTALINQAVTKGLNPNAPMKDSGSDWIGETPTHWEVRQLKYLCVLQRGFDLPSQERKEGHYPIYGGGGITGYHNTAMVQAPGIVTGRYGTVGEVYLVEEPFWPLNTSLYVKEFWGNSPTFIKYLLSVIPIKSYSAKSAVPGVDRNDLHIIPVARPPREEQDLIVQYLEQASDYKQRMTETIERQIEKLQEYRRSLITAAVTGKLEISEVEADV